MNYYNVGQTSIFSYLVELINGKKQAFGKLMYEKIAVVMNKSKSAGNYKIERKRVLLYSFKRYKFFS